MTLYTALVTVCEAAAPMIPFMTEEIYQNIVRSVDENAPASIHLCDFPAYQADQVDEKLEADMDMVLKIVVLGRACRNSAAIKNRQPIGQMYVKAEGDRSKTGCLSYTYVLLPAPDLKHSQYHALKLLHLLQQHACV